MPRFEIIGVADNGSNNGPEAVATFNASLHDLIEAPDAVTAVETLWATNSLPADDFKSGLAEYGEPYAVEAVVNVELGDITIVHTHTDGEAITHHVAPLFATATQEVSA